MAAALARHDELLRATIEAEGGHIFKTLGDAFYSAFTDAGAALATAVLAQRRLATEDWSAFARPAADFDPLRVRMAVHTGEAEARGGDYFSPALNRTARLLAAGHGGQILLSQATHEQVAHAPPDGIGLRDLGEHRLRDLRSAEHIWQAVVPGLPDVVRPLSTAGELADRDRIVVADPSAARAGDLAPVIVDRSVPETLSALHGVIRGAAREVVLTADQIRAVTQHRPADLTEYRLCRVAEWSQPRYRLDGRFVALTLLVDQGEEAASGRWAPMPQRYDDLGALLGGIAERAVVVLGPPGAGKSTLLRHLELEEALAGLRDGSATPRVPFFVQLNQFGSDAPGRAPPSPGEWLAARWAERYPGLPALDALLAEGRVTLLLDALNEMPAAVGRPYQEPVGWWQAWLVRLNAERPGNRVVFSCRTLDYSAPLSSPAARVPQVVIEPLSDTQVHAFLAAYSPVRGEEIWNAIAGTPQLEALRAPYFLELLVEQVEATGEMPTDRAGLFTGFLRHTLKREVERGGELFTPNELLTDRDVRKVVQWRWRNPYELPGRGQLLPKLAGLAYGMQALEGGGARHVRVGYDDALDLLATDRDEEIVRAGAALAVLEEDPASDEVLYRHQLLQEYFAGRVLAGAPEPERVHAAWRVSEITPGVRDLIERLPPAEELPALEQTGWEETTLLAVAMSPAPQDYVTALMGTNLELAGRAAAQATVRSRLSEAVLDELRWALVARSRDRAADLRARIAAALTLGWLGDPRFAQRKGPDGEFLSPPMIALPGGSCPVGDDDPVGGSDKLWHDHEPRHTVHVAPFAIGQFPVTNAEWARFMAAGGYEDERWWDTPDARGWQRGESTSASVHARVRWQVGQFRAQPELLDWLYTSGQWPERGVERYRERVAMSEADLDAHLRQLYPGGKLREPGFWRLERLNNPAQPVVGVSWYEARAYCAWLSAQSGSAFRLPTEVEHEAAQRSASARRWASGDDFDPLAANTAEARLKRTSPVGVFVEGDTPEGVSDLCGNVAEWTRSRWGPDPGEAAYRYPYDPSDGREDVSAGADMLWVLRGGSWANVAEYARAANRINRGPGSRQDTDGFRLVSPS